MSKKKKYKGIIPEILEAKESTYTEFSTEKLYEILKEMYEKAPKSERELTIGQYCETNGFVLRTTLDLKICNNKKCKSCQSFTNSFHKGLKDYVKNMPKYGK